MPPGHRWKEVQHTYSSPSPSFCHSSSTLGTACLNRSVLVPFCTPSPLVISTSSYRSFSLLVTYSSLTSFFILSCHSPLFVIPSSFVFLVVSSPHLLFLPLCTFLLSTCYSSPTFQSPSLFVLPLHLVIPSPQMSFSTSCHYFCQFV